MYTCFFGFKEKPFNITPDPRFFYNNPLYDEVYANLCYAVKERKGFAALIGEVGTGKTTLVRKLMDDLAMTARFVYFYNTNLTFEELLTFVCEELQLQVGRIPGRLGKIMALNEFLLEQRRKGGTGVLVVDEAQNLGEDVLENLRLLSNIETGSEKLLQIVLVGQPELKTKLDRPELRQLRQRISIYCRLDSLKEREVGPFVSYRLKAVGYRQDDLFTPEAIRKIAFYSNGIPRLINILCDNALLIAYAIRQGTVSAGIIEEVARDLQSGAERGPNDGRDPADKIEPKDSKEEDLYLKADDGLHEKSINVARDESPSREHLPDMKTGSAESEKIGDVIPTGDPVSPIVDVSEQQDAPMTPFTVESRLLNKIDGLRDMQAIANGISNNGTSDTVPTQFFDLLSSALTEAMGPMAPLVVRERLATLGNSSTTFPKATVEKLVELVSCEILDDLLKNAFKERMSAAIGALNNRESYSIKEVT